MRKILATLFTFVLILGPATPAFGWGVKGHKTVGQIAQLHLTNPHTLTRISQILKPHETLASIANWADTVKKESKFNPLATSSDSDTQAFYRNMRNQHNRRWHFVDLALNCASYDLCPEFQEHDDIVKMINLCIRKLRGGQVAQLTRRNALRMLVHLVGDLHQPLHVGVGFIKVDESNGTIEVERDPDEIRANQYPSDIGANKLLISGENSNNLHSFWDTDLVEAAIGNRSIFAFGTSLKNSIGPESGWNAQGQITTWAKQWATDSLKVSGANVYAGVTIESEVIIDDDSKYTVSLGANYKNDNQPVVERQLAKGGYRLAKLLEAIFP